jgi:hypothetical protein
MFIISSNFDGLSNDVLIEKELVSLGYSQEFAKIVAEFDIYITTGQKSSDGRQVLKKSQMSEDASDLELIQQHEAQEGQLPEYIEIGESNPDYELNKLNPKEQKFNAEMEDRLERHKNIL